MTAFKEEVLRNAILAKGLNPETLKPSFEWTQATADDVRLMLSICELSGSQAGSLVGVDGRTIRKWTGGDSSIPFAAWALFVEEAGLGKIAMRKSKKLDT
ncbi:TPA: hypothetical protein N2G45_002873 [Salmonella enterica]|nr:hypothetical protein [Salmonella enterica]HCL5283968.1 hypothetical protein [Salmonella enterica]